MKLSRTRTRRSVWRSFADEDAAQVAGAADDQDVFGRERPGRRLRARASETIFLMSLRLERADDLVLLVDDGADVDALHLHVLGDRRQQLFVVGSWPRSILIALKARYGASREELSAPDRIIRRSCWMETWQRNSSALVDDERARPGARFRSSGWLPGSSRSRG